MATVKYLTPANLNVIFSTVKDYVDNTVDGAKPQVATASRAGIVKAGANISVAADGTISTHAAPTALSQLNNDTSFQTKAQLDAAITSAKQAVKDELINGAPAAYDTLKEISDYITAHGNVTAAVNEAIGNRYTKEEIDGMFAQGIPVPDGIDGSKTGTVYESLRYLNGSISAIETELGYSKIDNGEFTRLNNIEASVAACCTTAKAEATYLKKSEAVAYTDKEIVDIALAVYNA